jgi:hypothetical protein
MDGYNTGYRNKSDSVIISGIENNSGIRYKTGNSVEVR